MANVSVMAADGINPDSSIRLNTTNDEVGRVNVFAVDLVFGDFATAANTYVLGKIPVGSIVTNVTCVVTSAWNDGFDMGISDVNGTAGTDGDIDGLADDSGVNNHTVGIYTGGRTVHASNNFLGHNCITDSYIVISAVADMTQGAMKVFIEYVAPL
jgi:hypothetical protein